MRLLGSGGVDGNIGKVIDLKKRGEIEKIGFPFSSK